MTLQGAVVFCVTIAWLVWVISREFSQGVNLAVTLLISMPHRLRLSISSMPDLTIHRIILVILLVYWFRSGRYVGSLKRARFIGLLAVFASAQFLSLLFSVQLVASLKD